MSTMLHPSLPTPDPHHQPRQNRAWISVLAVLWAMGMCFAVAYGILAGSVQEFFSAALVMTFVAGVTSIVMVLKHIGQLSHRYCGYCGYDRVGLAKRDPCPECGRDALSTDAPGHRAVGARTLPWWFLLFPVVTVVAAMALLRLLPGGRNEEVIMPVVFGIIVLTGAVAAWHAWHQVK